MIDVYLWRQRKHGRAANKQGACSPTCCEESPRAMGQKVSLGDQQARFEVCREASVELHDIEVGHLQQHSNAVSTLLECQLNGAHSPHASFVAILHGVLSELQLWMSLDGVSFLRCPHLQVCTEASRVNFHDGRVSMEAEEARSRSEQTGSLLPNMLRGKSPCLGTESVTGRPAGPLRSLQGSFGGAARHRGWPLATAQ